MRPLAITIGDPCGIGPEVALKAALNSSIQAICTPILIGDAPLLKQQAKESHLLWSDEWVVPKVSTNTSLPLQIICENNQDYSHHQRGETSVQGGLSSMSYLKKALSLLKKKHVSAIVTAPIDKKSWQMAGYSGLGHTDFLADFFGVENYLMSFFCDEMKVAVLTRHISLKNVSAHISQEKLLKTLHLIQKTVKPYVSSDKVHIAVCGVNPHAGENGILGKEEESIIKPAIKKAIEEGLHISGPFPADTLFVAENRKHYDFILAMYHDQGLIPFKMLAFEKGVNVTLGLPCIRTSVDHGTAYDIVGKNIAKEGSMLEAIKWATKLA
ncbi:4-hydroxythreonine-4-phosphate dehydrogenase PdxA [PVC group bacterium (ex Bugula neritina AB1)]|nr:4-hydroxythreonine-4-phosphate dehydrogenase PdxA [PVC group bacterium (ex Bugula neritina AB1)]